MVAPAQATRARDWVLVAAGYSAAVLLVAWPLPLSLTTAIGGDWGDSTFIAWTLWWVQEHLLALLQGDAGAWATMWNAPIFAPHAGTLAYSEHFLAQGALGLPVFAATGNPILVYNLVLLATLALTGVATHGLTRQLTGSHLAATAAGLIGTFSDYRFLWSISHLHALSNGWWLTALWALDRVAETGSARAAVAAAASLSIFAYSSNYLTAFCAPFTGLFVLWALARRGHLRDRRRWSLILSVALVNAAAVVPLMSRYLAMRDGLQFAWSLEAVVGNSANLAAYRAAMPWLGPLLALAAVGAAAPRRAVPSLTPAARWVLALLSLLAFLLAMGPAITIGDSAVPGPYLLLQRFVPGFEGLRVAHRYVSVALVFVSVLAGVGVLWLTRSRLGVVAAWVAVAFGTHTAWSTPFPLDRPLPSQVLAVPPDYLRPAPTAPLLYRFVATLPVDAIVVELPFGDIPYEIRYTYFTAAHRRRILNGYSGVLPPSYEARRAVLAAPLANPDAAWAALAPATHVVVHDGAWRDDTGPRVRAWLEARGARVAAGVAGATLYALPAR
ncbi:MAG: hypothetical protein JNL48_13730 [Acidobacteria bacterium]|nr:hypothetical protein [Acidobacteriota bacterium]